MKLARLARSADIRYKGQINEVEVPVRPGRSTPRRSQTLVGDFHRRYETVVRQGRRVPEARLEIRHVPACARRRQRQAAPFVAARETDRSPLRRRRAGTRPVTGRARRLRSDPCVWGHRLRP